MLSCCPRCLPQYSRSVQRQKPCLVEGRCEQLQHSAACSAHRRIEPDEQEGIIGGKDCLYGFCHLVQACGLHGGLDPSSQLPTPVIAQNDLQAGMPGAWPVQLEEQMVAAQGRCRWPHCTEGYAGVSSWCSTSYRVLSAAGGACAAEPAEGSGFPAMQPGMQEPGDRPWLGWVDELFCDSARSAQGPCSLTSSC